MNELELNPFGVFAMIKNAVWEQHAQQRKAFISDLQSQVRKVKGTPLAWPKGMYAEHVIKWDKENRIPTDEVVQEQVAQFMQAQMSQQALQLNGMQG